MLIIVSFGCRELGESLGDEELRAMIEEFDLDGDGESKCQPRLLIVCNNNH